MEENNFKIDLSQIPDFELEMLCRSLIKACEKFYSDPKNVERFEAWKEAQSKDY
ncbi:MAG: hypothetical protein LUF00_13145 [Lachnospiraceae bacterium]|nr:hypothetical protein [Lachnospiraceae bacterium]